MNGYECWEIAGHTLEYLDDDHVYICDGIVLKSITECLRIKFGNKYRAVDRLTLQTAAEKGTETHRAIEEWCKEGIESELPELRNFKFLKNVYKFDVIDNEVPVILFDEGEPILAGRLDLVIQMTDDGKTMLGLGDIKRTSSLDREYLGYQLNLYRIAYQQCYGKKVEFLRGLHLRENTRKYVVIPINEPLAWGLIRDWQEAERFNQEIDERRRANDKSR